VDKGFLVASGEKRDKSYSLPGMEPPSPEEVFSSALTPVNNLTHNIGSLTHNIGSLTHNDSDVVELNENRDDKGRFISNLIDEPFVDNLDDLTEPFRKELNALGAPAREQHRLDAETMRTLIARLCHGHYISAAVLETLLARKPQSLRQNYLKPMVAEGILKMAFPHKPNSPKQGYTTVS
jgi:hypothetical protein